MCFLTRCYVREASVHNRFKHGKTKFNGIWKHAISKNWTELTENRWNSSGQISQDSLHHRFSPRSRKWWKKCSVNLSNSKDGLSSCQCITTLNGKQMETNNYVLLILEPWQDMQKDSRRTLVVYRARSEKTWYGSSVQAEWRKGDVAEHMLLNFGEKLRWWKENHSLQRKWRNRWIDSSHGYFCQSDQYLRSSRRLVQPIRPKLCWKWDLWIIGDTDWECQR